MIPSTILSATHICSSQVNFQTELPDSNKIAVQKEKRTFLDDKYANVEQYSFLR